MTVYLPTILNLTKKKTNEDRQAGGRSSERKEKERKKKGKRKKKGICFALSNMEKIIRLKKDVQFDMQITNNMITKNDRSVRFSYLKL